MQLPGSIQVPPSTPRAIYFFNLHDLVTRVVTVHGKIVWTIHRRVGRAHETVVGRRLLLVCGSRNPRGADFEPKLDLGSPDNLPDVLLFIER